MEWEELPARLERLAAEVAKIEAAAAECEVETLPVPSTLEELRAAATALRQAEEVHQRVADLKARVGRMPKALTQLRRDGVMACLGHGPTAVAGAALLSKTQVGRIRESAGVTKTQGRHVQHGPDRDQEGKAL